MAKLNKCSEDDLDFVCASYLNGDSYEKIADGLLSRGVDYTRWSIGDYIRSEEGQNRLNEHRTDLIRLWKNEPFAEKFSRVHSLVEEYARLKQYLQTLIVGQDEYYDVSKELREYAKLIKGEMEPVSLEVTSKTDPFEQIALVMESLDNEGIPEQDNSGELDQIQEGSIRGDRLPAPLETEADPLP